MAYYHSKYGTGKRRKSRSGFSRIIYTILLVAILVSLFVGYLFYRVAFKPNTWVGDGEKTFLYIPTGTDFETLRIILYENGLIVNRKDFEWMAKKKNLTNHVNPGRYLITGGMSNNELVNLLRSGEQQPLQVTFNNIRTKSELAGKISHQIEADSIDIMRFLNDSAYLNQQGFTEENILAMFIPNTYEVYWTTSAIGFMKRMEKEYTRFWNDNRRSKAEALGMSPQEVSILASIVEKETTKNDEKSDIAGVYINRLKYNWRLQADPTVVFAWGDFSIRRVLNIHKEIDSPYNTYKYGGLPPGPICVPSIASIDAVLNPADHNYLFFCAKDDFSGYHVFARTQAQHSLNANKYRQALNKKNILK